MYSIGTIPNRQQRGGRIVPPPPLDEVIRRPDGTPYNPPRPETVAERIAREEREEAARLIEIARLDALIADLLRQREVAVALAERRAARK